MKTPDDLTVDLVLAEPNIGQPLSMKWDSRGRLWVVNYLQYPNPAGLTMVSRDKFLRSVYDKVPPAPPNHFHGADKITIHEDTDGDGKYDKHSTFIDGFKNRANAKLVFRFLNEGVVHYLDVSGCVPPRSLKSMPDKDDDEQHDDAEQGPTQPSPDAHGDE